MYKPSKWILEALLKSYVPARKRPTPRWVQLILIDLYEKE